MKLRNCVLTVLCLLPVILAGCAGFGVKSQMSSGCYRDIGEAEKKKLLLERVNERWAAMVAQDFSHVYDLFDPFFRARVSKEGYLSMRNVDVDYINPGIKSVEIRGNVARVVIEYEYRVRAVKGKEVSLPARKGTVEEYWLYVGDNWYNQFINYAFGDTFARY
ncbi:hypothetical protein [Thermodesulforhabdus norvegica]|uniref:DUF4440 domain-containing protein n=1 Tax=Thermodesulforhabdus norvegica TaxID=39841 RepID=A0A1I4UZS4_9BACT|nr:hypothetical protein [Thermodesulforhabdus norvegica]SFM94527.1 hypothetical protein SAMN05660836_02067 [Thermodesulforhabdus norvegica]